MSVRNDTWEEHFLHVNSVGMNLLHNHIQMKSFLALRSAGSGGDKIPVCLNPGIYHIELLTSTVLLTSLLYFFSVVWSHDWKPQGSISCSVRIFQTN